MPEEKEIVIIPIIPETPEVEVIPVCPEEPEYETVPICPLNPEEPFCEIPKRRNTMTHVVRECESLGDILCNCDMTLDEFFMINDACDVCLKPCSEVKVFQKERGPRRRFY